MKGSGAAIMTIMIILVLIIFLFIYMSLLFSVGEKSVQLSLEEANILKAKNTVYLINRSLFYTWLVSATQALFKTVEESVGCGIDDLEFEEIYSKNRIGVGVYDIDVLDKFYWYQYNTSRKKTARLPRGDNKYNTDFGLPAEPRICYPSEIHLQEYLASKFEPFMQIAKEFIVNGIPFEIEFTNTLDKKPFAISVTDNAANFFVSQKIFAEFSSGKIDFGTTIHVAIKTKIKNLVETGRAIVREILQISDTTESGTDPDKVKRRSKFVWPPDLTKDIYTKLVENELKKRFVAVLADGIDLDPSRDVKINLELRAKNEKDKGMGLFPLDGILIHYDADITLHEKMPTASFVCTLPPDEYKTIVEDIISDDWKFGNVPRTVYSREEIRNLVYGIINTESGWDPLAVNNCGAAGLMQLMPGVAKDQGLEPIFEDADFTECNPEYARRLRSAGQDPSIDARFDPRQNIEAGIEHLHDLFDIITRDSGGTDKGNIRKLVVAAYNTGTRNLYASIGRAGSYVWEDIASGDIAAETANYVPSVLACFEYYNGGTEKVANYLWPTESRKITSCYGLRKHPVTGEIKPHLGLDIGIGRVGKNDVRAAEDGRVEEVKSDCIPGDKKCGGGLGNFVRISHGGYETLYSHLKRGSIQVSKRQRVRKNDIIAEMGNTGLSTSTHLHFEVIKDGKKMNPCNFINCQESTGLPCSGEVDVSIFPNIYYKHDESENMFRPRPFSLRLKVEDTLHAINCAYQGELSRRQNSRPDILYSWERPGDIACCGGYIWSCNADVPGIGKHGLVTGDVITSSIGPSGEACAGAISNFYIPINPDEKTVLRCTSSGFDLAVTERQST